MSENSSRKNTIAIIKFSILLLVLTAVPALLYLRCSDTLFNMEWLRQLPSYLRQYHREAALILAGFQVLQVIICIIPGQPIQFAASYMFGVLRGYLISIAGAVIGALAAFWIARLLGKDALHVIFGEEKVREYQRRLNSGRGLLAVLVIYLIPGLPKDLVAYVAGISNMRVRPFILISTIGRTPGMIGSLLLGHFFGRKNYKAIVFLAVITAVMLIVCWIRKDSLIGILDSIEERDAAGHGNIGEREAAGHGNIGEREAAGHGSDEEARDI